MRYEFNSYWYNLNEVVLIFAMINNEIFTNVDLSVRCGNKYELSGYFGKKMGFKIFSRTDETEYKT